MTRLASRSPAAPFQSSRPAPVIPSHQQAKDSQDEARRQQQTDEKIRELQSENALLREALQEIVHAVDVERQNDDPNYPAMAGYARGTARRALNGNPPAALNGGGDGDE